MKRGGKRLRAGAVCAGLALPVRFLLVGYGMTALCFFGLGLCLIFFGLMARWGTAASRRLAAAAGLCLLLGFGLFLAAEIPVLRDARSDEDTDADYLIVLGAAVHGDIPSLTLVERTEAARTWLEAHPAGKAVVSGGQGAGEDLSEAQAMADYLTARGVDPARVLREDKAASTYENIRYSLAVIRADGGDPAGRVAVCSSEYHLCRARYIAQAQGCDPAMVAARTSHIALAANYAVREAFALWKCWLFGVA